MNIRVADNIHDVQQLRGLWQEARATAVQKALFQDHDWNLLALSVFRDERPFFIAAEATSSIAILPLVIRNRTLSLAGGPLFDYRDAICAGDDSAFSIALDVAAGIGLPIAISGIRGEAAARRWRLLSPQAWTVAPSVSASRVTSEEFENEHARGRRTLRRLDELGVTVNKSVATPEIIDRLYRAKAAEPCSWGQNVFRDERCISFMRELVALPAMQCEIFQLAVAGRFIAFLVTFIDEDVRRFYTTWMDSAWSHHSPGIALLYEATRLTLEEGLDCDYMTGDQPYKMRFATGSTPLYKIDANALQLPAFKREELRAA